MLTTEPFDIPAEPIIDLPTGLSINVPLVHQVPEGWLTTFEGDYSRIRAAREALGIVIDDGFDSIETDEYLFQDSEEEGPWEG